MKDDANFLTPHSKYTTLKLKHPARFFFFESTLKKSPQHYFVITQYKLVQLPKTNRLKLDLSEYFIARESRVCAQCFLIRLRMFSYLDFDLNQRMKGTPSDGRVIRTKAAQSRKCGENLRSKSRKAATPASPGSLL